MRFRIFLGLACIVLGPHDASALDLKAVQKKYQGIKEVVAEIDQTKTSPLLIRPLKSKVKLSFQNDVLSWTVEGQEPWRIRFAGKDRAEFLNPNKALADIPPAAKAKLDRTLILVRKILVMDPSMDEEFSQKLTGETLTITPKARSGSASVFFEDVSILFKKDLSIQSIKLRTPDDETRLDFRTLVTKPL